LKYKYTVNSKSCSKVQFTENFVFKALPKLNFLSNFHQLLDLHDQIYRKLYLVCEVSSGRVLHHKSASCLSSHPEHQHNTCTRTWEINDLLVLHCTIKPVLKTTCKHRPLLQNLSAKTTHPISYQTIFSDFQMLTETTRNQICCSHGWSLQKGLTL